MSEESERWKEKYLKSLERQEKLERRWEARLDLLRRGLVRSTLAAEGSDKAVDQCMKEMREVVRTDEMDAALAGLIPRLEKAVLDSEQRREVRVEQIGSALNALVAQLQTLPLSRDVSRPLKKFAKGLDERASQAREIPLLLGELSKLQGDALSQLEMPEQPVRPGLLQRLFGGKEPGTEEAVVPGAAVDATHEPAVASPAAAPIERAAEGVESSAIAPAPASVPLEKIQVAAPAEEVLIAAPVEASEAEPEPNAAFAEGAEDAVDTPVPEPEAEPVAQSAPESEPAVAPEVEAAADAIAEPAASSAFVALPANDEPLPKPMPSAPLPIFLDSLPLPPVMAEALAAIDPNAPAEDILYALPDTPEPSYSSVATHIEDTLLGLLNDLSVPERHQPQADSLKGRLEHGLNWYELLPILDDLAVLMLAVNDSGQHEFETYLQELNRRLEGFQSQLREASDGHADNHNVAREMDSELREQVDGLQSSVAGATDIVNLKGILDSRLEGLLGTLDAHQQQRDLREQEVASRLQALAERVSTMETEALGYREHLEEQRQKALNDPLTGLPNRAAWSERLELEVAQWQETGDPLMLAMIDLDHFKVINDSYGHLAGDKVLKIIASQLQKRLRAGDFIARFGGEEFVVSMPRTAQADGAQVLEGLRAAIEACPFHFKGQRVTITTSIGFSGFKPHERADAVLKRADQALYKAKEAGRNTVMPG
jgi:diguanylate cyclase